MMWELVEQNRGLRRTCRRRQPKRLPHVHDRKPDARALLHAEPGIELAHARLRPVLATKPDRPAPQKIAHHDPIGVTLADRDLVDAKRPVLSTTRLGMLCPEMAAERMGSAHPDFEAF